MRQMLRRLLRNLTTEAYPLFMCGIRERTGCKEAEEITNCKAAIAQHHEYLAT
jgi:hypothetical protein